MSIYFPIQNYTNIWEENFCYLCVVVAVYLFGKKEM